MFDPDRDYVMELMQKRVSWLEKETLRQLRVGNVTTAMHFSNVLWEAKNIILDVAVMIVENPQTTAEDIRRYVRKLAAES